MTNDNEDFDDLKVYTNMLMAKKEGEKSDELLNHNGDTLKRLTFDNEISKDRYFEQDQYSWPHSSPGSTTVISVGNRWKQDEDGLCEAMVRDMCIHSQKQGYKILFEEHAVWMGNFPNAAVASTREQGAYTARENGTEYVFFVDNDIKPEENLLTNLLSFNVPMIVPMVWDTPKNNMIGGPIREKDSGVCNQKWASMSALLIKTSLLDLPGVKFVDSDTEGLFFQRFARWGHTVHIDTSQVLYTVTPPTRPDSMDFDQRFRMAIKRYNSIFEPRVPMDAIAQEMFDKKAATGKNQIKTIKL